MGKIEVYIYIYGKRITIWNILGMPNSSQSENFYGWPLPNCPYTALPGLNGYAHDVPYYLLTLRTH
jgi:hypothetical protein